MDYLESASPSRGSLCAIAHRSRLIPVCLLSQIRLAYQDGQHTPCTASWCI